MALPGVTLSGKIETITGVADPGTVTITLQNYGSTAPIVSGTAQIAVVTKVIQAAADGTWSTSLWGNDQIAPPNTYYTVVITTSDNVKVWSAAYVINSGVYDISNLSPMSAGLPVALPTTAIVSNPAAPQAINTYGLTVPSLIAGSITTGKPKYNVVFYGADNTGVADSTTAILAAIAAAKSANGGVIYFPAGKYLVAAGLTITDASGLQFRGDGAYPSATIRGTTIFTNSTTADVFKILPADASSGSYFSIRDLRVLGPGSGTGNGLVVDASSFTMGHFDLNNVIVQSAGAHGVVLKAGQAAGGFLFDGEINRVVSINNGGDGFYIFGRTSELTFSSTYSDSNPAGNAYTVNGGTGAEAQNITFITPVAGVCLTSMLLQDCLSVAVIGMHSESASSSIVNLNFCRRAVFLGGNILQSGTADGFVFNAGLSSSVFSDHCVIDTPGWLNTSSKTRVHYVGGSLADIQFGTHADGLFTRADVTGSEFPAESFTFRYRLHDPVTFRNAAHTADVTGLSINGSDQVQVGDSTHSGIIPLSLLFTGSTSGTSTVKAAAVASGVLTLPAATDTLVGKATTDVLTNKTLDTAGAGNVLKINGTQVSTVTGTGAAVLATSPTLVTPTIGGVAPTTSALTVQTFSGTAGFVGSANTMFSGKTGTDLGIDANAVGNHVYLGSGGNVALDVTSGAVAVTGTLAVSGATTLNSTANKAGQNSIAAATAAINTTETVLVKSAAALNVNRLVAGSTINIKLRGTCTASVANVSTFGVRIGTAGTTADTLAAAFATAASAASGTSVPFAADITLVVRTTGVGGTAVAYLTLVNQGVTGIATTATQVISGTMIAFDTTASDFISATYKSAAATTTCTFDIASIEVLYN